MCNSCIITLPNFFEILAILVHLGILGVFWILEEVFKLVVNIEILVIHVYNYMRGISITFSGRQINKVTNAKLKMYEFEFKIFWFDYTVIQGGQNKLAVYAITFRFKIVLFQCSWIEYISMKSRNKNVKNCGFPLPLSFFKAQPR